MSQIDFLSDTALRDKAVNSLEKHIRTIKIDFIVAARPRDVAIASPVAFRLGLPLIYLDDDERINSPTGLWGKSGVLIADKIESIKAVEPAIDQVNANGGSVTHALILSSIKVEIATDLKHLGVLSITKP
jgi:hypothetical protein